MPVHSKESILWLIAILVDERAIDSQSTNSEFFDMEGKIPGKQ
jgi:hypothetical protein